MLTLFDIVHISLVSGDDLSDPRRVVMRVEDLVEAGVALLLVQEFNQLLH